MHIVSKDIENAKKIKIVYMNTLHDRFPDFDFGEDGQATNNSKIVMYYYILKQPR